jgi:hypothetical protein
MAMASMASLAVLAPITRYDCRYLDARRPATVYAVAAGDARYATSTCWRNNSRAQECTVLIAYACPHAAHAACEDAAELWGVAARPVAVELEELAFMASGRMRVPLAVVLSADCDIDTRGTRHTLYFSDRQPEMLPRNKSPRPPPPTRRRRRTG